MGSGVVGRRVRRFLDDLGAIQAQSSHPIGPTAEGDVAVLASGGSHADMAGLLLTRGVGVVTVGDDVDDCSDLVSLGDIAEANDVPLVIGAALSPGLSGLLVRSMLPELRVCSEIHIALHGTAGPACARAYHRSLSGRTSMWWDGEMKTAPGGSGRELLWFPEPVGPQDCYLAEIASPLLLHRSLPDVARISVRRSARRRDRLTARLPMMRPPHAEGRIGALRVEVRGIDHAGRRVTIVRGVAEQIGTASASVAAAFAESAAAGKLPSGLTLAGDPIVNDLGMLRRVTRRGIRVQQYSGSEVD